MLLVKRRGIEAWCWSADRFALLTDDLFEGLDVAWPHGWFDPAAGEFLVGAAGAGGLVATSLSRPGQHELIPFGELDAGWFGPVVAFDATRGELFALCTTSGGHELRVWRGGQIVTLGPTPDLTSITFDPGHQRLVGESLHGTHVLESSGTWLRLGSPRGWLASQCAWHPGRQKLVRLEFDPARRDTMRLSCLDAHGWRVAEPQVRLPAVRPRASLATLGNEDLLAHGGARGPEGLLDEGTESFLSVVGRDFEPSLQASQLRLGRLYTMVHSVDAPLAVVDQSALKLSTLTEAGWQSTPLRASPAGLGGPHDDRRTTFTSAPRGVVYELDDDGGLWRASPGGLLEQVAPAERGPGPRCTGHTSLAHDVVRSLLVLFGGSERNDTWLFDETTGTWRELLSAPRPPHGPGALCSTPAGVYLFVQHELWRLDDEQWRCVGHDPDWMSWMLLCDPKRRALWSAADGRVVVWRRGKFRDVARLPDEVTIHPYPFDRRHLIGLDPLHDRLVTWDPTGARVLPLSSLGEAATGQLPVRPRQPPTRRRSRPPRGALRAAARFKPLEGTSPAMRVPGVRVPPGYRLLAVIPTHPRILPLPEGVAGLAVMVPESSFEAYEHTRVVQLTRGAPVGVWLRGPQGLRPCEWIEHQEIDPKWQEELDTLPGHQFDHAFSTKVGGFGRFVQEDPAPRCAKCKTPMRFALQLGCEVFMVGDMGETYAFFCLRGCGASAVLQTH